MTSLFISYSRKDIEIAKKLTEAFKGQDLDFWIDWEGIPPTVDWWKEIERGIEQADIFLFLLSPDSATSKVCKKEIEHAVKNGKRLIPVVIRDVKADEAPNEFRPLNWIFLRESDNFQSAFSKIITAIKTDYDWVQSHRQLQVKALEWERNNHENGFLLHGKELQDAEVQLARNSSKEPYSTELQHEYVLKSRQTNDRQRRITFGISIAGVIALALLAVFGFIKAAQATEQANIALTERANSEANLVVANTAQANAEFARSTAVANEKEAKTQAKIALARQLAAQAQSLSTSNNMKQIIAVLLATQSMQLFPSVEAFQVLDRNVLAYHVAHMTHDPDSFVTSVAFSPDGKYVATGSVSPSLFGDNTARVWEIATSQEVARMTHDNGVEAVTFSPDGRYVASASQDQTVRVWESTTGKEVARMIHDTPVYGVAFSPDGKYVVSRSDKTARVWDVATGKEVAHMAHGYHVNFAAFSPDSQYVISAGCDELSNDGPTCSEGSVRVWETFTGKVRVWEALTGKEVHHMIQDASVASVVLSPNGEYVISGSSDGNARVWKVGTAMEVTRITHEDPVDSVVFSPDGKYWVSRSSEGAAQVREVATGNPISILVYETLNSEPWISSMAFSRDGKYVAVGGCDHAAGGAYCILGGIHVWELHSKRTITHMTHGLRVKSVAFSPDSRYVVSAGCEELRNTYLLNCSKGSTRVWKVNTGKEITRTSDDPGVQSAAFSPDGKYIVSTGCDHFQGDLCDRGRITVWGASSGYEIARMSHEGSVSSVAFSPDGKYIVSGGYDNTARIWETATGKEIARMTHDSNVLTVAFSPDGKFVASGDSSGTAVIWKATNGIEVSRIVDYLDRSVSALAFSPNGKYVVVSGSLGGNDSIHVWEAATGKDISIITYADLDLTPDVNSVGFSPDGRYVVSGSCDQRIIEDVCIRGSARVWETETGREITRIVHESSVNFVAFSPDGKYVLSMDLHNVRVWEAATGQEVAHITYAKGVTSVAFSPDGKYIVSGSVDGEVTIREYRARDLSTDACSRVTRNLTHAEWKQYIGDALPYQAICPNLPIEPEPTITP